MAGSVREKAIFYVGGRRVGPATVGGGSTILPTGPHALDGPSHTGDLPLERISTDETDTTVVAHPDGTGGVEFGVVTAEDVTIVDAGGYFTATDVEGALQEVGAGGIGGTFLTKIEGGQDTIKAHGSSGSTETFDPTDGNVHTVTLNANCTFTLNAPVGSGAATLEIYALQDGTGGRAITWPGSVIWPGGVTPTPTTTAATVTRYILETLDGGTTWYGVMVGASTGSALTVKDEGSSLDTAVTSIDVVGAGATATNTGHAVTLTIPGQTFATPAVVLGTAAAAGAASTGIRSDSTIVAFDATTPATQAVGDSGTVGVAAVAARRDHKHPLTRPSLDDLSDATITSAASGNRLRYNGSAWVNSALRWEPHVDYTGSVMLDSAGNPLMHEVTA